MPRWDGVEHRACVSLVDQKSVSRWVQRTVRECVDDLILIESAELVVDVAFDGSGWISWQASVSIG